MPNTILFHILEQTFTMIYQPHINSPAFQNLEQKLIHLIVDLTKPEMIFRLQHEHNMELPQSFIHWLLVLPDIDQHSFSHYESLIELLKLQQESLDITVIKAAALHQQITEGHIYYTMCCRKENLLYCNTAKPLPLKTNVDLAPHVKEITKQFNNGFEKASWFFKQARILFEDFHNDALCGFAVQQAAELSLRIFILCLTGRDTKTHAITQLLAKCRYIAPHVAAVFPANTTEEKNRLQILEKAYLAGRYSHSFEIEPEVLHDLMTKTGLLLKKIKKVFNEYIVSISAAP